MKFQNLNRFGIIFLLSVTCESFKRYFKYMYLIFSELLKINQAMLESFANDSFELLPKQTIHENHSCVRNVRDWFGGIVLEIELKTRLKYKSTIRFQYFFWKVLSIYHAANQSFTFERRMIHMIRLSEWFVWIVFKYWWGIS